MTISKFKYWIQSCLDESPGPLYRFHPSMCWGDGSLDGENKVESFTVSAADGSEFLVTITKLRDKR